MKTWMWSCLAACAGAVLVSGCASSARIGDPYFANVDSKANVYARQAQARVLKIAVMPFKASTELIGSSVSDMVVTELLRTQKYALVERGQMSKVLSEAELAMAGVSESKAVEAAKMLGAEAVVIGTVDEYGTQAKGGDTYAVVGLSIRLIDCTNAKIIWSADLAKMAEDDDIPLATHARQVVHELVSGLYQNLTGQSGSLPPSAPAGVNVSEMGLREAVVQWEKPAFPARYRVERAPTQQGPFVAVGEVAAMDGMFVDSGPSLKDAAVYYYRVVGIARNGTASEPSAVVETMTAPPPDPPGKVVASAPSSRCVSLKWSPPRSDGVVKYTVERAVAGEKSWKQVGTSATTVFRDGGEKGCDLSDSTKYRYRVFAENRVGAVSAASKESEVATLPPPAKVAEFSAVTDEVRCAPLSWRESPEADVSGYEIERAEGKDAEFERLAVVQGKATVVFEDGERKEGNLRDGVVYRYRIRAFNPVGGQGEWSSVASVVTKPMPKTPTGVKTTIDVAGKVGVSWVKNAEEFVTGYTVESRSDGGWFSRTVAANVSECAAEETGLDAGENRLYRVRAEDRYGRSSEWSEEVAGAARPLPPPPTGLKAVQDGGMCRLSFVPPRDGMSEFRIYRKKLFGSEFVKSSKAPEATVEAPPAGESAEYVVTAVDECGLESEQSEKVTIGG